MSRECVRGRVRRCELRNGNVRACVSQTRTNFEETSKQTESLMKKMMEMRQMVRAAMRRGNRN